MILTAPRLPMRCVLCFLVVCARGGGARRNEVKALGLVRARGDSGGDSGGRPWAVITGASGGIGAACARRACAEGYSVVLHGRDRAALARVAASLGGDCETRVVVGDLASARGAEALHGRCRSLDVTLLLSNAGAARVAPVVDDDLAGLDGMLALNVRSTVALCRLFGGDFAERGAGTVVITSSLTGVPAHGVAGTACYGATKAFLRSFGNALHDELRPRGVRVTVLLPGAVDSGFARTAGMERALVFAVPGARLLGLVGTPDAVARAAFSANGSREVVPGLFMKAYAAATEALPNVVGRTLARWAFMPSPFSSRRPAPAALGVARGGAAEVGRGARFRSAIRARFRSAGPALAAPRPLEPEAPAWATKAEFEAVWRSLPAPDATAIAGAFDGDLVALGVAAPASGFITHRLFPPSGGGRWIGKVFRADGAGANRFAHGAVARDFTWSVTPSARDGRPALVLAYADPLWGGALRMRDELRELRPGYLLGLGSMGATGGVANSAPFVLRRVEARS